MRGWGSRRRWSFWRWAGTLAASVAIAILGTVATVNVQDWNDARVTRAGLEAVASSNDPSAHTLGQAIDGYVERTVLMPTGIETGRIKMKDGSSARYWFKSHHASRGIGGTLFKLSDGTTTFMSGYFCCEAQFPRAQFAELAELRAFIDMHDGSPP